MLQMYVSYVCIKCIHPMCVLDVYIRCLYTLNVFIYFMFKHIFLHRAGMEAGLRLYHSCMLGMYLSV